MGSDPASIPVAAAFSIGTHRDAEPSFGTITLTAPHIDPDLNTGTATAEVLMSMAPSITAAPSALTRATKARSRPGSVVVFDVKRCNGLAYTSSATADECASRTSPEEEAWIGRWPPWTE